MAAVIVKVKVQTNLCFLPCRCSVCCEGVRGQHEHHNKQSNDKEENKDWFVILLYNYYNQTLLPVNSAYLARVVLFLLCSPILSPLEVVSRKVFDEFTQLNKVRNFCHIFPHF